MRFLYFGIFIFVCSLLHAQKNDELFRKAESLDAEVVQKAKEGDANSLIALAQTSEKGKAIVIEIAEKNENAQIVENAQMALGLNCELREKDYKQAIVWFTKAGEQGNGEAWYTIGNFYMEGLGVNSDIKKAFEYWLKGADCGDVNAMTMVGIVYSEGLGVVDIDVYKAFKYYKMSAELGCSTAQWHLGRCYQRGIGVGKNLTEAKKWFQLSAEQGEDRAIKSLKEMSNETPMK